jgi:transposase
MPVIERWRALLRMGFARGEQRSQRARFPVSLDELIPEDHLVRVIGLWVDRVEVARLGFAKAAPKATGASALRSG